MSGASPEYTSEGIFLLQLRIGVTIDVPPSRTSPELDVTCDIRNVSLACPEYQSCFLGDSYHVRATSPNAWANNLYTTNKYRLASGRDTNGVLLVSDYLSLGSHGAMTLPILFSAARAIPSLTIISIGSNSHLNNIFVYCSQLRGGRFVLPPFKIYVPWAFIITIIGYGTVDA